MHQDVQGACSNCRMRKRTNSSTTASLTKVHPAHLGGGIMFSRQSFFPLPLRRLGGKSQTVGGRGQLHHGVNSDFLLFQMKHFACRKFNLLAIDGERCNKYTYRAHVFLMRSLAAWLKGLTAQGQHEAWNIVFCPKVFTSPRGMSYVTSLMSGTPSQ